MAVNIDTVYQRVLALANKEQRGYITPQEFNLLANQAQYEIFEQYFYDLNQRKRLEQVKDAKAGAEDVEVLIEEKLAPFKTIATVTNGTTYPANYMVGRIFTNSRVCTELPRNEVLSIQQSSRHAAYLARNPVYCISVTNGEDIEVYNNAGQVIGGNVTCEVYTRPASVEWDYVVVGEKALHNSGGNTVNFVLHESEESSLVMKILELAGVTINKPGLVQIAGGKETAETQIEKQ
tara:strand:+ start:7126 stop:7830 length:705 start_codon:yes stop_codon:yes gene_type:complete